MAGGAAASNPTGAKGLGKSSIAVAIVGILITIGVIAGVLVVVL